MQATLGGASKTRCEVPTSGADTADSGELRLSFAKRLMDFPQHSVALGCPLIRSCTVLNGTPDLLAQLISLFRGFQRVALRAPDLGKERSAR